MKNKKCCTRPENTTFCFFFVLFLTGIPLSCDLANLKYLSNVPDAVFPSRKHMKVHRWLVILQCHDLYNTTVQKEIVRCALWSDGVIRLYLFTLSFCNVTVYFIGSSFSYLYWKNQIIMDFNLLRGFSFVLNSKINCTHKVGLMTEFEKLLSIYGIKKYHISEE